MFRLFLSMITLISVAVVVTHDAKAQASSCGENRTLLAKTRSCLLGVREAISGCRDIRDFTSPVHPLVPVTSPPTVWERLSGRDRSSVDFPTVRCCTGTYGVPAGTYTVTVVTNPQRYDDEDLTMTLRTPRRGGGWDTYSMTCTGGYRYRTDAYYDDYGLVLESTRPPGRTSAVYGVHSGFTIGDFRRGFGWTPYFTAGSRSSSSGTTRASDPPVTDAAAATE